ncbi:MAG: alpha/beta hydrolase [Chitinophagaceae bacterium]|nr:MAG: alpha/beta hydrolase [Chitinophagaceae bacterium]
MTLYFIPGLGADHRVFSRLVLPPHCKPVYLDWIKPVPGETLHDYSLRFGEAIDATRPFGLIGLSMGGMVATEIAQVKPPVHTVLLSSATSVRQLTGFERALGSLHLEKALPGRLLKQPNPLLYHVLSAEDEATRTLVKNMQHDTDPDHFKWSLRAILDWKNETLPPRLVRIHGSADRLIPARNVPADHLIEGAGHLAVFTHAAQVSGILAALFPG